jgi:hypothetical protein
LVLEGVPPHAWDKEVVQDLLGSSCAIDVVEYTMASRENLDLFKVSAWTTSLDRILPARTLAIPEPEEAGDEMPSPAREFSEDSRSTIPLRPLEEMKLLKYKVLIHVDSIEEDVRSLRRGRGWFPPLPSATRAVFPTLQALKAGARDVGCHGGKECKTSAAKASRGPIHLGTSVHSARWLQPVNMFLRIIHGHFPRDVFIA